MPARESDAAGPRRRLTVTIEDLDWLYVRVRGAPYANPLTEAKLSLEQKDHARTLALVQAARDGYERSHRKVLRKDAEAIDRSRKSGRAEAERLRAKQDKYQAILDVFDEIIGSLKRLMEIRSGAESRRQSAESRLDEWAEPEFFQRFRQQYETAPSTRGQLAAIRHYFRIVAVQTEQDIRTGQLYYLVAKKHAYLVVVVPPFEPNSATVPVRVALSGQAMKPVLTTKFLELGRRRSLVRLEPLPTPGRAAADAADDLLPGESATQEPLRGSEDDEVLDVGAFSQLHDAAKRSGLVPNADVIAHTRDREFRRKEYQRAFQVVESLFGKFSIAASQREQRLRREDADLSSGKLRMSPKELLEKRARDTAESQLVERARNRFMRVLNGLQVLARK